MRLVLVFLATTAGALGLTSACEHPAPRHSSAEVPAPRDAVPAPGAAAHLAPTHILAADADYYTSGPQQGRPPDGTWRAGTKVLLLKSSGAYSLVRSPDGITGYVAAGTLMPGPG